ncbi:hypothetical protein ACTFIU_009793 [Dictyostelium citrinum]
MMNSLRMNPSQYKENFMKPYGFTNLENVITSKYYEPTTPLQFNERLFDMALSHSIDMSASDDCFTFENCNGTSFYDRIEDWKCDENTQEHIYKTSTSNNGFKAINRLICRNSINCLNDDAPDVGDFRDRIMGKDINYSGTGIVYNQTLSTWFYTMDFTLTSCTPQNDQQSGDKSIISASHTFKYGDPNSTSSTSPFYSQLPQQQLPITFIANYFNSSNSLYSLNLYVISKNRNFTIMLNKLYSSDNGKSSNGVYSITLNENSYRTCDYYYFKAITKNGLIQRYPTKGFLKIVDYKQTCNDAWSETSTTFLPTVPSLPQNHFYNFFPNFINNHETNNKEVEINNDKSINYKYYITSNTTLLNISKYLILFLINFILLFC